MKRVLSLVLALVLVLGMIPMGFAADATAGQTLKGYGIIAGDENGNLNEDQNLNRAEMMVVLARLMGKGAEAQAFALPSTFTDLAGFEWASPWIAYAEMNEWTAGVGANMFNPAGNVTAQEAAVFMLKALGYEADVDFTWANAVEFATAKGLFAGVDTAATSPILRGDLFTMMITTLNTEVKAGTGKLGIVLGYMEEEVLKVVSVKAINLAQIEVTYNMNVEDNDDATDDEYYVFEDEDEDEIALDVDADGKVVTLTLIEVVDDVENVIGVDNQSEGLLTIDEAIVGDELEYEVEFFDVTLPTVVGAEVVGNDTIKVMFSEPIDYLAADDAEDEFELNDGEFFVDEVIFMNNNTEANVVFYAEFETETYELAVGNGLEDFAGLNLTPKTLDVKVVEDSTAPKLVGYKDASLTEVTLVFDEDIEPADGAASLDPTDFYHTNSSNPAETAVIDGNEIELTFAYDEDADIDNRMPNGTAYVYVEDEVIQDLWDNVNESKLFIAVTAAADETAPKVVEVEVDAQDELIVTFSEELDEEEAQVEGNYTLVDADGDEVDVDTATLQANDDGDMVEVLLELEDEIYGDYTLTVVDVEDLAGNAIVKQSISFEAEDETNPEFADFTATLYDVDDDIYTIIVDFDEEMAIEGKYSVLDLEKYEIDGINLADIDEDEINIKVIDGNEKVKIEIEDENSEDLVVEAGQELILGRVADAAGNYTVALVSSLEIEILIAEAGTIAADTIEVTDNNKIVLTLDGKITSFDAGDFMIYYSNDGGETSLGELQVAGARLNNTGSDSVITFTLDDDENELNDDATYTYDDELASAKVYIVTESDGDNNYSETEYGEVVEIEADLEESNLAVDKIAPELDEMDDEDYVVASGYSVTLFFTEAIDEDTVSKFDFEVEDTNVLSVSVSEDGREITLVTDPDEDMPEMGTNVTQKSAIYDLEGNALTGLSTEVNFVD